MIEDDIQDECPPPVRSRRPAASSTEGAATSGSKLKGGEEKTRNLALPSGELPVNPGYVTIGARMTHNLGDYESLQVYASVSMPCEPTKEGYLTAKKRAAKLVGEFMEEERQEILGNRSTPR